MEKFHNVETCLSKILHSEVEVTREELEAQRQIYDYLEELPEEDVFRLFDSGVFNSIFLAFVADVFHELKEHATPKMVIDHLDMNLNCYSSKSVLENWKDEIKDYL